MLMDSIIKKRKAKRIKIKMKSAHSGHLSVSWHSKLNPLNCIYLPNCFVTIPLYPSGQTQDSEE